MYAEWVHQKIDIPTIAVIVQTGKTCNRMQLQTKGGKRHNPSPLCQSLNSGPWPGKTRVSFGNV